jgi:hypothetical protein
MLSACASWALVTADVAVAMLYPVAVNVGLLTYFVLSLRSGHTAIERLARIEDPALPEEAVPYTRFLTKVWCGVFLLNAALALLTVVLGDRLLWAVYNGVVGYALVGTILLAERLLRPRLSRARFWRPARVLDLSSLMMADRDPDALVARRATGFVTWASFRDQVLAKAGFISRSPASEWLIGDGDAVEFASGLLAVAMSGRHAIVPQNLRPETIADLRLRFPQLSPVPIGAPDVPPLKPARISREARVSFQTSGSTGSPTLVTRPFGCLADEVEAHECTWGPLVGRGEFAGTVPHHFIYGALFRVLWPLAAGRIFDADPLADGFAIHARLKVSPGAVVVSSPSVLSRLPERPSEAGARPSAVFSSGSPLSADAARGCRESLSAATEVYGSTETGGVAWRSRKDDEAPWQTFPGVSVARAADGRLELRSPFAPSSPFILDDEVEVDADGRFRLLGRADRIAKVEGRRVSLAELEASITSETWVGECAVFPLAEGARLAVALTPRWTVPLPDVAAALSALRARLALRHDAVVVPRTWRILPALPRDSRGKLTMALLRASLMETRAGEASPESVFPTLLAHHCDGAKAEIDLLVSPELPLFAGHFPGHPILPGVSLVDWAAKVAAAIFGCTPAPSGVDQLKFNQPTFPGEFIRLRLDWLRDSVQFTYLDASGNPKAAGILRAQAP